MTIKQLAKRLKTLPKYEIEVGVFSLQSKREDFAKIGITNAELMFIHENGSPARGIPSRPVLQMTIDYANSTLLPNVLEKCVNAYINSSFDEKTVDKELKKLCIRMENYARDIIYLNDGRLAPNSPKVAARKKENHPLFDTGQLAKSITCRLIKYTNNKPIEV